MYLFPFPLFHIAAYNVVHHHLRRRPVVILPRFDPVAVMAAIEAERVTSVSIAPTMVAMMLDHPERPAYDLGSLRQIGYGASAMPLGPAAPDAGRAPRRRAGPGVRHDRDVRQRRVPRTRRTPTSGQAPNRTCSPPQDALPRWSACASRTTTAPRCHEATSGEILVRGDQLCAGYWNDPLTTAASLVVDPGTTDGWFRTGDVGRIDEAGFLYVVDRKKDLVITGGENVSCREVEDVLGQHPAISAVAVVGVPDERWGERVCAVIVATGDQTPDEAAIIAWTEGRLAGFKRPRLVVTVEALPLNASGKVEKQVIRDMVRPGWSEPASSEPVQDGGGGEVTQRLALVEPERQRAPARRWSPRWPGSGRCAHGTAPGTRRR